MKRDADLDHELLDSLLAAWHQWQQASRASRGFAPKSLVVGDYRTSRQYDDCNGKLDADLDDLRCKQVDFEVSEMGEPHRSAIYALARNLATGHEVWSSPRLPPDRIAREIILCEARAMLISRLVASGVL